MAEEQLVQAPAPMTDAPSLPGADAPDTTEQAPEVNSGIDAPAGGSAAPSAPAPAATGAETVDPGAAADSVGTGGVPAVTPTATPTVTPDTAPDATALPDLPDNFMDAVQNPDLLLDHAVAMSGPAVRFLYDGGPMIWAIAALSVITVALILWKIWRLALIGAWSRGKAKDAVEAFEAGQVERAKYIVQGRRSLRSKCVYAALTAREIYDEDAAREDAARVAKREIGKASGGLRPLELISTVAPLLGLLGTVLGMITAFQALQEAGSRADPAMLAGGIWEALLTTAAGMAVAIPASAALAWFEGILDAMAADVEDGVTRIFVAPHQHPEPAALAAE